MLALVLTTIALVLLALLVLLLVLLVLPLRLSLDAASDLEPEPELAPGANAGSGRSPLCDQRRVNRGAHLRVRVRLLAPLLPWWSLVDTARAPSRGAGGRARKPASRPGKRGKHRPQRGAARNQVRVSRMAGAAPRLLRGLLGAVRIERLRLDARFGLEDPATTGEIFGLLTPLVYGAGGLAPTPGALRLVPVFDRECLEGRIELVLSLVPMRWVAPLLRFGWDVFAPRRGARR